MILRKFEYAMGTREKIPKRYECVRGTRERIPKDVNVILEVLNM